MGDGFICLEESVGLRSLIFTLVIVVASFPAVAAEDGEGTGFLGYLAVALVIAYVFLRGLKKGKGKNRDDS